MRLSLLCGGERNLPERYRVTRTKIPNRQQRRARLVRADPVNAYEQFPDTAGRKLGRQTGRKQALQRAAQVRLIRPARNGQRERFVNHRKKKGSIVSGASLRLM